MLILFCVDFFGLAAKRFQFANCRHLSFGTTIVSIGLLATFVGVLVGLYGFDSADISASVPRLLEGLRFAFAASVLGMFLSVLLSILHKFLGGTAEDEDVLHSIDRKMGALVTTIESPGELVRQFSEMKIFLKEQMEQVNSSLDQALTQLSRGASQEVVQALERIIKDFNQNLTSQFGDNFKELNTACHRLIEWQGNYKTHIETAEEGLQAILDSLEESCEAAQEINQANQQTQKVCKEVGGLIRTYDVQVGTLATHLQSCKALGEQAGQFLTYTQKAISQSADNLNQFSGVIENSVGKQSESLARLTKDIDQQLPKALGELEKVLTDITNQFAADYRSLFQFITDKR